LFPDEEEPEGQAEAQPDQPKSHEESRSTAPAVAKAPTATAKATALSATGALCAAAESASASASSAPRAVSAFVAAAAIAPASHGRVASKPSKPDVVAAPGAEKPHTGRPLGPQTDKVHTKDKDAAILNASTFSKRAPTKKLERDSAADPFGFQDAVNRFTSRYIHCFISPSFQYHSDDQAEKHTLKKGIEKRPTKVVGAKKKKKKSCDRISF
jgi:hypothetical protein